MTKSEHILFLVAEECAEIAQRASKAARFGLKEIQAGQEFPNDQRVWHEVADLLGVLQVWKDYGMVSPPPDYADRIDAKIEKVNKWLNYSAACGTLLSEKVDAKKD